MTNPSPLSLRSAASALLEQWDRLEFAAIEIEIERLRASLEAATPLTAPVASERKAFEAWFSQDFKHPRAVERLPLGAYVLMQAESAWNVWQARAALATPPQTPAGDHYVIRADQLEMSDEAVARASESARRGRAMLASMLPPLPKPWSVASTIKCDACGKPYEPQRTGSFATNAMFALSGKHACSCGCTKFSGTLGYDSPSPAIYTAEQMQAYARAAVGAAPNPESPHD